MAPDLKPNVIVFFTDQQRWDTCGCYGTNPMGLTPVLDRMAARGTMMRHSFTVQPLCMPARACFQTGLYPTRTGVWRNGIALPPNAATIGRYFKQTGYSTAYIGKWHLAMTELAPVPKELRAGYEDFWLASDVLELQSHPYDLQMWDTEDRLVRRGGYRVDAQTDCAIEFLESRAAADEPFFLFNSYLEPHHQNDLNRHVAPDGYAAKYQDFYVPPDLEGREGDWPMELPDYYGSCARLDENLGRVLQTLRKTGLEERTIVLFASDHGSHFRTRNGEYKRSCHEASIRVPTVFQGPGFDGGHVIEELVSILDWPATLLDAAGIPMPENAMDGRSFLPLVRGEKIRWRDSVYVLISESQLGRALRTRHWKYGVDAPDEDGNSAPSSSVYVEQYLYDLAADPYEQNNLVDAPSMKSVRTDLAAQLRRCMEDAGEAAARILPAGGN